MSVSIPSPTILEGRDMGSRCINVEFNLLETNSVGNKRRFPLKFNSNWNESVYGKEHELRNSYWTREGLTVEVNGEGKRHIAWNSNKGGLRSSKWVKRSQREHVVGPSSGSRVPKNLVVQKNPVVGSNQDCNTQVSFPVIPNLESTSPIRMEVGESPSLGDLRPSNDEAQASAMSNASHKASIAQVVMSSHHDEFMREVDTTRVGGSHAEESLAPLEKASTVRNQSSKMVMSSAGQTEMTSLPAKAPVVTQCPFSDGFHVEDSPATLDRANITLIHTIRTDTLSVPLTENMGCLAKTSVEAKCLIFNRSHVNEPSITLGKAKTEDDKALIGLVLSNYVLSPSRVGTEKLGV
nr:hypothetical protein CFP56_39685 [Quercus suber]